MTATATPSPAAPAPSALPRARGAARRALVRWTVRLFRREWRQQLLLLGLLTVSVGATVAGVGLAVNASVAQSADLGRATRIVDLPGTAPRLAEDVAALRAAFGAAEAVAHTEVTAPGAVAALDVRDQAPGGALGAPMLRLVAGRYPTAPDEAALTDGAAAAFGARVGAVLGLGGRAVTVVGLVENPGRLSEEFVLVPPGAIAAPDHVSVLLRVGDDGLRGFRLPDGTGLSTRGYSALAASQAAALVLAVATVGMLFVGLLAVAGFAVLAQRRLRSLGMLGALGATDRQVRLVLVAAGAVTGVVGAALGVVLGLAGWMAAAGPLERAVDHRIDRFALPWWSVPAAFALAVATATAAAWWPARVAARTSVVAALSGRPPEPRPVRRSAALGSVVLAGGVALLSISHQRRTAPIVGGTVAVTLGLLLLAPALVRAAGTAAPRLPVAARLALRDLARYRGRSGAAVGAAALAVGIAATVAVSAAAAASTERAQGLRGNLPADELVVYAGRPGFGPVAVATDEQLAAARSAVAQIARATGAAASAELRTAVYPDAPTVSLAGVTGVPPVALVQPDLRDGQPIGYRWRSSLYVATPEVLRYLGLDPSVADPAVDVLTARRDLAGTVLEGPHGKDRAAAPQVDTVTPVTAALDLPAYTSEPTTLLTPAAVERLGLRTAPVAWAVRTSGPLDGERLTTVLRTAAAAGLTVEQRTPGRDLGRVRTIATAIGALVALGVLAMTVGLIRAERAGDVRTLAAAGASDRTRRTVVAVTAGVLGLLGGALGTAGAYAALLAWHHHRLTPLRDVPVAHLAALVVGLPLVAAAGGWLLAGREPRRLGRAPSR